MRGYGIERHKDFMVSGSEHFDLNSNVITYVTDQIDAVTVSTVTVNYKSLYS